MPVTSCQISYGLYDVTAREDASYSSNDAQSFTDFDVFNKDDVEISPKIATLETDYWLLDGSFDLFPDDDTELSYLYWSESMSDANGNFADYPELDIQFTSSHTSNGLTFSFDEPTNDYPSKMLVTWYNNTGDILSTGYYIPTNSEWFVDNPVVNYWRIAIVFMGTHNPERYIKTTRIDFGSEKVFSGDNIISANLLEDVDPLSSELPVNTLTATLYSEEEDFSPLNPKGFYALLQESQKIDVTEIVNGVHINMGSFYLNDWKNATDRRITITGVCALGLMDKTDYNGGIYTGEMSADLISDIFDSVNLEYSLDESLSSIPIYGHLPIASHRASIQQIAFAIGAIVDCSRSDIVQMYPIPPSSSHAIPASRQYSNKISLEAAVTGVSVVSHGYAKSSESMEIINDELPIGAYEFVFSEPLYNLTITGASITDSGVNYANINVSSEGQVHMTGLKYTHSQKIITKKMDPLPANIRENVLPVESATLIGLGNAMSVAERVYDYYQNRFKCEFEVLPTQEIPGDMTINESLRSERLRGYIRSIQTNLSGGFLSKIVMRGKRIETTSFDYAGELWAGDEIGVI